MSKPLWIQIFDNLKAGIESGKYAPDAPLPPELEIAEAWSVSRLTAHRALYELQRAGLVARKRKVGTVVLGPKPPTSVRIGALFFHAGDFFQGNLLAGVRAGLPEDSHLSYVDTRRDPETEAAALEKMRQEADGIVLFPTCHPDNDELLRAILADGPPLVCVDRQPPEVECDSVQTDNYAATRHALRDLVSAGHRKIACFCDFEESVSSTSDRVRAYRDTMAMVGADSHRHFYAFPYLAPDSEEEYRQMVEMVQDALSETLDSDNPRTAVFCTREHYASAVIEACGNLDVPAPEIAAFVDRPPYLMALPNTVRRVVQDLDSIARTAAHRVLRRIGGEELPPVRILIPPLERPIESIPVL
jgi:GntR family transcriptional regulator, arabinose operon transcriptional repressor